MSIEKENATCTALTSDKEDLTEDKGCVVELCKFPRGYKSQFGHYIYQTLQFFVKTGVLQIRLRDPSGEIKTALVQRFTTFTIPTLVDFQLENVGKITTEVIRIRYGEYLKGDDFVEFEETAQKDVKDVKSTKSTLSGYS